MTQQASPPGLGGGGGPTQTHRISLSGPEQQDLDPGMCRRLPRGAARTSEGSVRGQLGLPCPIHTNGVTVTVYEKHDPQTKKSLHGSSLQGPPSSGIPGCTVVGEGRSPCWVQSAWGTTGGTSPCLHTRAAGKAAENHAAPAAVPGGCALAPV